MTLNAITFDKGKCIDTLTISDVSCVEIEQMNDNAYWIGIFRKDGSSWEGAFVRDDAAVMLAEYENAGVQWRVTGSTDEELDLVEPPAPDPVNHPAHYTSDPSGVECIEITRHRNFNVGNAIKYLWRAGLKDADTVVQDLEKARWYITDEINRLSAAQPKEKQCQQSPSPG